MSTLRLYLTLFVLVAGLASGPSTRSDALPVDRPVNPSALSRPERLDDEENTDDSETDDDELVAEAEDDDDLTPAEHDELVAVAAAEDPDSTIEANDVASLPMLAQAAAPASALRAPQVGSAENPFANTCDGKAIGFAGPAGDRPRMELRGAPAGAVFRCRTGPAKTVSGQPFAPCDGADGKKPLHIPDLKAEGTHRTEVQYVAGGRTSAAAIVTYYVHRSLDRVSCCRPALPDARWFEAARPVLAAPVRFTAARLDNPFIAIPKPQVRKDRSRRDTMTVLSLRRTFRLSPDGQLVLIRRTMASRRALERKDPNACVGLRIAEPVRTIPARQRLTCPLKVRQSDYRGGLTESKCPGVYCTVTTCNVTGAGCRRVSHTFNRGPGQKPWVVTKTTCPPGLLTSLKTHQCEAYVLNARGQAVCLTAPKGTVQVTKAFVDGRGTGLRILNRQRPQRPLTDAYVFSAKTRSEKVKNVLFLPD